MHPVVWVMQEEEERTEECVYKFVVLVAFLVKTNLIRLQVNESPVMSATKFQTHYMYQLTNRFTARSTYTTKT
jgi:hypothetical protein